MRDDTKAPSDVEPSYEHLNYLLGYREYLVGWTTRVANKDHVDLFGKPIAHGETYYAFDRGVATVDRLAEASMLVLLQVVFRKPSPWLGKFEERLREQDKDLTDRLG